MCLVCLGVLVFWFVGVWFWLLLTCGVCCFGFVDVAFCVCVSCLKGFSFFCVCSFYSRKRKRQQLCSQRCAFRRSVPRQKPPTFLNLVLAFVFRVCSFSSRKRKRQQLISQRCAFGRSVPRPKTSNMFGSVFGFRFLHLPLFFSQTETATTFFTALCILEICPPPENLQHV